MKKRYLNPQQLFEPRFFTHTVAVSGGFTLAFVAGQVAYDRDGLVVGKGDIRAQSEQVFKSLTLNLKAVGADWGDVVKMNAYMVHATPDALNIYREVRSRFLDPKALPASTLIGIERLVHDDLLLEVEVIAAIPARSVPKSSKR